METSTKKSCKIYIKCKYLKGLFMRVMVFGVCNWDTEEDALGQKEHLEDWLTRVNYFIKPSNVFLAAGTYSNPKWSPLPQLRLVQNYWIPLGPYSPVNNYFRNGFMAGLWHSLINEYGNFDILFHMQCRQLIGEDITDKLSDFLNHKDKFIIAPRWRDYDHNRWCNYVDISNVGMKPIAVQMLTAMGLRPSIGLRIDPGEEYYVQSEEEAALLFQNHWYNPWPEIETTRQISWRLYPRKNKELTREELLKLPFVATTRKNSIEEDINEWKRTHPYNRLN
jgi:hypothetical protein